ncbi:transferase family hexapeptide repeat protein [Pseudomonas duriflava]|uniref:Transferase family hexapeptide repeat protein n=1 Tax=Pseudomonas duriflava TaxID=459528 RepID=A0A562QBU0_9PSED|nr:serine acetyltransferase [Pseudomonas duriflava]TWI54208.1 transferase family hexapeptide repeat protein [Pseudomonas duriflava]
MTVYSRFAELKRYWHIEIIGGLEKPFSWSRLRQKCKRSNRYAYLFWFRLAYVLHQSKSQFWRRRAKLFNERLSRRYNVEIMLGATIGEGLWIAHPTGIVISGYAVIGKHFKIWQNCTIGIKNESEEKRIVIGDNVKFFAHSCLIGDNIVIGDDVVIGAASFVNKDIPSGCTYITQKQAVVGARASG